jgi:hypothetical protein
VSRHFGDLDAVLAFDARRKTLPSTVPRWGTVAVLSALEEADAAIIMARADATGRTKREKLVCKSCAEPAYDLVAMPSREAAHVFEVGRQPEAGPRADDVLGDWNL